MNTQYDETVLVQCADDLYAQARVIVVWTTLKYGFLLGLVGFLAVVIFARVQPRSPEQDSSMAIGIAVVSALVGLAMGFEAGRTKAFALRLEAQKTLCQRQVELNTRNLVSRTGLNAESVVTNEV